MISKALLGEQVSAAHSCSEALLVLQEAYA